MIFLQILILQILFKIFILTTLVVITLLEYNVKK